MTYCHVRCSYRPEASRPVRMGVPTTLILAVCVACGSVPQSSCRKIAIAPPATSWRYSSNSGFASVPGTWSPGGHSVRIAASPRAFGAPDAGAPVDAVYSNLKVWDLTLN